MSECARALVCTSETQTTALVEEAEAEAAALPQEGELNSLAVYSLQRPRCVLEWRR